MWTCVLNAQVLEQERLRCCGCTYREEIGPRPPRLRLKLGSNELITAREFLRYPLFTEITLGRPTARDVYQVRARKLRSTSESATLISRWRGGVTGVCGRYDRQRPLPDSGAIRRNTLSSILGAILGFLLAVPLSYLFFVLREKRRTPILEYKKTASVSLASVGEKVKNKIVLTYDGTPVANIRSFEVEIKNSGKVPVGKIPVIFEFHDETVEILDIEANFEPEDKTRNIQLSESDDKRNQKRVFIKPGLDGGDKAKFNIFIKGGKDTELSSLKIMLGETQGIKWVSSDERFASRWGWVVWLVIGLIVIGFWTLFLVGAKSISSMTTRQIAFIGAQQIVAGIMGAVIGAMLLLMALSKLK